MEKVSYAGKIPSGGAVAVKAPAQKKKKPAVTKKSGKDLRCK